ncbi:T9SS type A sorting domain-containing protein [bacterium]|nr:T9SS type A sorting domain-containing protein [bacterium]
MKNILLISLLFISFGIKAQCTKFKVRFSRPDTVSDTLICLPAKVVLEKKCQFDIDENASKYDEIDTFWWDFGDHSKRNSTNDQHNYFQTGTFDVKLIVKTKFGCLDSFTKKQAFTVIGPQAKFALQKDTVCQFDYLVLNDQSTVYGGSSDNMQYSWHFNNQIIETNKDSAQKVKYRATDSNGYEVYLRVSAKIADPVTNVLQKCVDLYPKKGGLLSPLSVFVTANDTPHIRHLSNGKYLVVNSKYYDDFYWVTNNSPDTFRTNTILADGSAYGFLYGIKNACTVRRKINLEVSVESTKIQLADIMYNPYGKEIIIKSVDENSIVSVCNLNGQSVFYQTKFSENYQIPVALYRGVLIVKIQTDNQIQSKKLIIY